MATGAVGPQQGLNKQLAWHRLWEPSSAISQGSKEPEVDSVQCALQDVVLVSFRPMRTEFRAPAQGTRASAVLSAARSASTIADPSKTHRRNFYEYYD